VRRWPNYLQGGYFDEQGNLKIEYVARCLAGEENLPYKEQHGVERFVRAMDEGDPPLTKTQLRRFFQHCRGLETRLRSGLATWPQLRAQVQLLDAISTDAFGKQPRKIPELFREFIRRNVTAVQCEKDFREGFLPHFEALVGFASFLLKDRY
jgi:CRISPR type III-A-associated protein Csm2